MLRLKLSGKYREIVHTSFPFMLLMMSQSINSIVDMFIVGHIGMDAIAAVGLCGFIFSIMTSGITGIMISVQTEVAKSVGSNRSDMAINALHSALIVAVLLGAAVIGLSYLLPSVLILFIHDHDLLENCISYLHMLSFAAPAIGMVRAFRGYYAAIGENRISVIIILLIYFFNFIIGFTLVYLGYGISGAGTGTSLAFYIGAFSFLISGRFLPQEYHFFKIHDAFSKIKSISLLSFYAGSQQLFFSGGFAVMFVIAGQMNSPSLAVITVLNNLMLLSITPLIGIGMASAVYVSKSIGSGKLKDAEEWGNIALKMGMVIFIIQMLILINPHQVMSVFIKDISIVNDYVWLFKITVIMVISEVFAQILKFSMFGAGYNKKIAITTIPLQWFVFIPSALYFCVYHHYDIAFLWFLFLTYRAIEAICLFIIWKKKNWLPADSEYKPQETVN
ncbi:MATE family efflux transporter [Pantoea agglomerans]|uniref:MATE family efflux transporter n=1 Tax=Enterobacter agglomerans TaxID=549 RepID=UPI0028976AA7|nr:MATE family efflux transporter [Pantoea agglomerans]WNK53218.1 MATE family efflux transporter [Pantoea agglomerans]